MQQNFLKRKHEHQQRAEKQLLLHALGDKGLTAVPTDGQQRAAGATEQNFALQGEVKAELGDTQCWECT